MAVRGVRRDKGPGGTGTDPALAGRIETVRRFNRFYTQRIGVLEEGLLKSPFTLAEARVLYELANRTDPTAAALGRDLGLDAGYLSRILRRFSARGLLAKLPSRRDGRESLLRLTERGRAAFEPLDAGSRAEIGALLAPLGEDGQRRLVEAMRVIEDLLGRPGRPAVPYILRPQRVGDIGWVIARHGTLYAEEYGWDERFEAMVAKVAAGIVERFDPARERWWIAEREGAIVGSVAVVAKSPTVAQLRLLIVEPSARGLGIGNRLVAECLAFARRTGYRKMVLWTNSILLAARHIYEREGFRLVRAEPHHSFGQDLVGEIWERRL